MLDRFGFHARIEFSVGGGYQHVVAVADEIEIGGTAGNYRHFIDGRKRSNTEAIKERGEEKPGWQW